MLVPCLYYLVPTLYHPLRVSVPRDRRRCNITPPLKLRFVLKAILTLDYRLYVACTVAYTGDM